jgi:hypothetical protein
VTFRTFSKKLCIRGLTTVETGVTKVAPKFSGVLILFSKGRGQIMPMGTTYDWLHLRKSHINATYLSGLPSPVKIKVIY